MTVLYLLFLSFPTLKLSFSVFISRIQNLNHIIGWQEWRRNNIAWRNIHILFLIVHIIVGICHWITKTKIKLLVSNVAFPTLTRLFISIPHIFNWRRNIIYDAKYHFISQYYLHYIFDFKSDFFSLSPVIEIGGVIFLSNKFRTNRMINLLSGFIIKPPFHHTSIFD